MLDKNNLIKFKELINSEDAFKITKFDNEGETNWGLLLSFNDIDKIQILFYSGLDTVFLKYSNQVSKSYEYNNIDVYKYGLVFDDINILNSFVQDIKDYINKKVENMD